MRVLITKGRPTCAGYRDDGRLAVMTAAVIGEL
jgi:hypothetical protein